MNVSVIDKATGAKVDAGDSSNNAVRVSGVQTNPVAVTPPYTAGAFAPFQGDPAGNLRTDDAEQIRNRASFEEMRFLEEGSQYLLMRSRAAEMWTPFVDRRGGSGQRGTVR